MPEVLIWRFNDLMIIMFKSVLQRIKSYPTLSLILLFTLNSCNHAGTNKNTAGGASQHDLSKIKIGMSFTDVLDLAGFPDEKINVGTVIDEFGHQTKTEEWHYGNNQLIVIVNDTVNDIDMDVKTTYEKIRHIIDSAKATGDTSAMIQQLQ